MFNSRCFCSMNEIMEVSRRKKKIGKWNDRNENWKWKFNKCPRGAVCWFRGSVSRWTVRIRWQSDPVTFIDIIVNRARRGGKFCVGRNSRVRNWACNARTYPRSIGRTFARFAATFRRLLPAYHSFANISRSFRFIKSVASYRRCFLIVLAITATTACGIFIFYFLFFC